MKKVLVFVLCSLFLVPLKAVDYCAPSSWGYAGNVTGGGNATPTLVNSVSQLDAALGGSQKPKNKVVIITQDLAFSEMLTIQDAQNITIMALPGVKLINNSTTKTDTKDYTGILFIKRTSNIILRNLTFIGPGAYDIDGSDNLCFEKVTNAWVDHCDFQDGLDGNFDIKSTTDNITVTWCRFRYLKTPIPGGSGGSNDHRFSNLVGSDSDDKPADGKYNITYGFCWWDEGCKQRMTRCRNALIHYLNCYWNSSVADYYVGPENASGYFEGCTFAGKANKPSGIWNPFNGTTNYCTFVNCTGNLPANSSTPVAAPTYAYDQLTPATAKSYVTNTSCGAGATLDVTNTGNVSSACDGSDPDPVLSDFWNISDDDFKNLDTIKSEISVRGLHITATTAKPIVVDANSQTMDDIQFTHRLKLGGTGNANYRHVWFDVSGDCAVTVYLMHASSSGDTRTLNIATGSFDNVVSTISAPVGSLVKQTYSYTGDANTLYLYSANSGINIYGIRLAYPEDPTDFERIENQSAAHKVLRHGQVLILRDGKTYNLLGQSL